MRDSSSTTRRIGPLAQRRIAVERRVEGRAGEDPGQEPHGRARVATSRACLPVAAAARETVSGDADLAAPCARRSRRARAARASSTDCPRRARRRGSRWCPRRGPPKSSARCAIDLSPGTVMLPRSNRPPVRWSRRPASPPPRWPARLTVRAASISATMRSASPPRSPPEHVEPRAHRSQRRTLPRARCRAGMSRHISGELAATRRIAERRPGEQTRTDRAHRRARCGNAAAAPGERQQVRHVAGQREQLVVRLGRHLDDVHAGPARRARARVAVDRRQHAARRRNRSRLGGGRPSSPFRDGMACSDEARDCQRRRALPDDSRLRAARVGDDRPTSRCGAIAAADSANSAPASPAAPARSPSPARRIVPARSTMPRTRKHRRGCCVRPIPTTSATQRPAAQRERERSPISPTPTTAMR